MAKWHGRLPPLYLGLTTLAVLALGANDAAKAAYIVTLTEVGSNVVATGSGTIDLTDLILCPPLVCSSLPVSVSARVFPAVGQIITGPPGPEPAFLYLAATGPMSFGPIHGTGTDADTGSGDIVGIKPVLIDDLFFLVLPPDYVSGNPLSDTSTYENQTFASLGVTLGTYAWNWGSGADADSFTLQIGPATTPMPEPGSLALFMSALAGLFGLRGLGRRFMSS